MPSRGGKERGDRPAFAPTNQRTRKPNTGCGAGNARRRPKAVISLAAGCWQRDLHGATKEEGGGERRKWLFSLQAATLVRAVCGAPITGCASTQPRRLIRRSVMPGARNQPGGATSMRPLPLYPRAPAWSEESAVLVCVCVCYAAMRIRVPTRATSGAKSSCVTDSAARLFPCNLTQLRLGFVYRV